MSSGKKKKAKAGKARSQFSGVNTFNVDLDGFASGQSSKSGNEINTSGSLSTPLQGLRDVATGGLNTQLGQLALTPSEQLQDIVDGNNSFFNLQSELNRRNVDELRGASRVNFGDRNLQNSTFRGAFEGQLANDAILQDLATRNSAIELANNQALQNAGLQNSVISGLSQIAAFPTGLANDNLFNAFQNLDQVAIANAQNETQASIANAQLAAQQQASRGSTLGNLIGSGLSAAALLGTGGLGGFAAPAIKGVTGSLFGGGGSNFGGGGFQAATGLGGLGTSVTGSLAPGSISVNPFIQSPIGF